MVYQPLSSALVESQDNRVLSCSHQLSDYQEVPLPAKKPKQVRNPLFTNQQWKQHSEQLRRPYRYPTGRR